MRPYGHALKTFVEHPVPLRRVQVDEFAGAAFIVDPDGVIATWNEAAAALFGIPSEEAIGKHCSEVVRASSLEGRPICGADCPFLRELSHQERTDEVEMQGASGARMCALLHHAPLQDAFGRSAGVLHTVTSVAERPALVHAA